MPELAEHSTADMKLSICIPTYNRREELLRLLASVEAAMKLVAPTAEIEVVVSDNASTDGTAEAVRSTQVRLSCLRYWRNNSNEGFASNLTRAIAMASGEYCWLMGSDDSLLPDALTRILQHIEHGSTVVIGNPVTRSVERRFFTFEDQRDIRVATSEDYVSYVSRCREISAAFAFMSALIVRRDFWNRVQLTQCEAEHPYVHMLRIVRGLATEGGQIRCLNAPLVVTGHSGNEWNATVLPHFELDLSTIRHIVDNIFDSSPSLMLAYGHVFRRQYSTIELLKSRVESTLDRWNRMAPLLRRFGYQRVLLEKTALDPVLLSLYFWIKKLRRRCGKSLS